MPKVLEKAISVWNMFVLRPILCLKSLGFRSTTVPVRVCSYMSIQGTLPSVDSTELESVSMGFFPTKSALTYGVPQSCFIALIYFSSILICNKYRVLFHFYADKTQIYVLSKVRAIISTL